MNKKMYKNINNSFNQTKTSREATNKQVFGQQSPSHMKKERKTTKQNLDTRLFEIKKTVDRMSATRYIHTQTEMLLRSAMPCPYVLRSITRCLLFLYCYFINDDCWTASHIISYLN